MGNRRQQINSFIATLPDLLRFLDNYQDDLVYVDINPSNPPAGARQLEMTAFPAHLAEQILDEVHPSPLPPRLTPTARQKIEAVKPLPPVPQKLAIGMNIDPKNGQGYPLQGPNLPLTKLDWVRFPFTSSRAQFSSLEAAFQFFDPIISDYNAAGVKIMLVLTHQTYGEGEGFVWGEMNAARWADFARGFVPVFERILRRYGDKIAAYELWNEGDAEIGNPSAVYYPPRDFALLLDRCEPLVRQLAPEATLVLGGLVRGPGVGVAYVNEIRAALNGRLPLDAIGLHPYGKGAPNDRTVFSRFGNVSDDLRLFSQAFPNIPLWLTEVGALGTDDPQFWDDAALYLRNLFRHLQANHAALAPVVVWYAWSDSMDIAQKTNGVVTMNLQPKPHLYQAFFDEVSQK
jgi:hypothetical protein